MYARNALNAIKIQIYSSTSTEKKNRDECTLLFNYCFIVRDRIITRNFLPSHCNA